MQSRANRRSSIWTFQTERGVLVSTERLALAPEIEHLHEPQLLRWNNRFRPLPMQLQGRSGLVRFQKRKLWRLLQLCLDCWLLGVPCYLLKCLRRNGFLLGLEISGLSKSDKLKIRPPVTWSAVSSRIDIASPSPKFLPACLAIRACLEDSYCILSPSC